MPINAPIRQPVDPNDPEAMYSQQAEEDKAAATKNAIEATIGKTFGQGSTAATSTAANWNNGATAKRDVLWGDAPGDAAYDVGRYQSFGAQMYDRPAYQQNYGSYDANAGRSLESRGQQGDALGLQRAAALGQAPSRAELLGRNMIDESLNAQMSAAASTRGGPAAQAAAARAAQSGAAAQRQRGMNDLSAMRADEMARARGDYMSGATAMRGGDMQAQGIDLQKVGLETQNEQFQRDLNQRGFTEMERMGFGVKEAQLNARTANRSAALAAMEAKRQADNQATATWIGGATGAMDAGVRLSGADKKDSDERTKIPMGSLGRLTTTSDDRAKVLAAERKAYLLGRAHANEQADTGKRVDFAYGGPPKKDEDIVDQDPSKARRERVAAGGKAATKSAPRAQAFAREEQPAADAAPYRTAAGVAGMAMPVAGAGHALYGSYQTLGGALDATNATGSQAVEQTRQDIRAAAGMTPDARATMQSDERTKTPMAGANRAMVAEPYAYKPEYAARNGQEPGELNVGPMAQRLAKDPVARTAVVEGEDGMLAIDQGKGLKLVMGGVADLQRQVDDLKKKRGDK